MMESVDRLREWGVLHMPSPYKEFSDLLDAIEAELAMIEGDAS